MKKLFIAFTIVGVVLFAYSTFTFNHKTIDKENKMADTAYPGTLAYDPNSGGIVTTVDNGANWVPYTQDLGAPSPPQPAPDPYAAWGGKAAHDTLVTGFNTQKQNIYGSANDAASNLQGGYNQSILDTVHNLTLGQQGIDRKNVQNESSRIQGGRSILDMIGRGIKSGGVMLANKNAGTSSAAGALANAYGQMGQRQLSSVGNQYAQNAGDIGVAQAEQDYQVGQAPGRFHEQLMGNVNSIVATARDSFAKLDAAMANASLPDRIAIEQEKENVRQQVLGKLQQYDAQLSQGVGGIHAATQDQNRATANTQLQAGQADPNTFQYTTQAPLQAQGAAPAGGNLPLFSVPRTKTQFA